VVSDRAGAADSTITTRAVRVNGVELYVTEAGAGPPVIFAHGFPELAYSWRHQLPAVAAAGFHAVAPDQRGYGRSSRPEAIEDYDINALTGDLLGVLDDLGEERAVFVGHDWGALLVWQLALLHPERVSGVVGMSVPFMPRPPMPPVELMRQVLGDAFFYIIYFQEPGVADAELGRDPRETMWRMLAGMSEGGEAPDFSHALANDGRGFVERLPVPTGLPAWLSQAEFDHFVAEFTRTGFTGGINWYRNLDRNWALTERIDGAKVSVPSLFIGGASDPVLIMSPPSVMDGWLDDHRGTVVIDGAGHWELQEKPDQVNAALITFLESLAADG